MWLFFAITTTLLWGVAELFYKKGARPEEDYAHLKTAVFVGLVMGLHAIYVIITNALAGEDGFVYNPINIIYYLPVSLCYIVSMTLSYFGMRFIEESISDPIENTSGAICSLLCVVFLGYKLEMMQVAAIALIAIGILGVGFLERTGDTDRRKKLGKMMAIVAFAMPFAYALLDAVGSMLDIYYLELETSPLIGVTEDTIENIANTSYELTFLISAIILFIFLKIKKVKMEIPRQKDKILAAICETAGQFTYVYAMADAGPIAAPIISSVCVVSLVLSRIFLKEKLKARQYVFIALIIIGIIVLGCFEEP